MYGTSQGYGGSTCSGYGSCGSGGGLEYIASSSTEYTGSLGEVFEYATSGFSFGGYGGSFVPVAMAGYSGQESGLKGYQNNLGYDLFKTEKNYHFIPDDFLRPGKEGIFVGKAEEIKSHIEEAFEKIFKVKFPNDVKISVLKEKEFRKINSSPGVMGLSINRKKQGWLSEIFVLEGSLGRVMLTIGHELGHVLTESLNNKHDEEAKAYAFSLEWMRVIKENNIGDLGGAIVMDKPAENGLHNVAFGFVSNLIKSGKRAWEIYLSLIRKIISVESYV